MKFNKIYMTILAVLTAMVITSCNMQLIDVTYSYEYAIIKMPDGSIVEGRVQSWADYEGEQLQIVIDGNTYLANSVNVVMMTHAPTNIMPTTKNGMMGNYTVKK